MNLSKMFEVQRALDTEIVKKHPKGLEENRLSKKILAAIVEVGECANEFRTSFKFWSDKKDNREKGLVELVDILHFILSIGIELKCEKIDAWEYPMNTENPDDAFLKLLGNMTNLDFLLRTEEDFEEINYEVIFAAYLALCKRLGFTWKQIEEAYMNKNKINWERQANGY